jgi:replication factor C large subunit
MWTEKYRMKSIDGFFGNERERHIVIDWLSHWVKGSKPLLMMGPPGTGKTSFVKSIAKYFDYDLVELNASDLRNKSNLEALIMPILVNSSLFGKRLILFLDEIDGISGRDDYGGLAFLGLVLKDADIPIIMASNSKNQKMKDVLKSSKIVTFLPLTPSASYLLIKYILNKEDKILDQDTIIKIIKDARGDARSLINSLQTIIEGTVQGYSKIGSEYEIEDSINKFFTVENIDQAKQILLNSTLQFSTPRFGYSQEERSKDFLNALYSSIVSNHRNISDEKLANVLHCLSEVDLFVNRIYENRNWRLLKYSNDVLLMKLFEASRNLNIKYSQYSIPFPLIGAIFMRGQSLRPLRVELSKQFHTSTSSVGLFFLSYFITVIKNGKFSAVEFNSNEDDKINEIIVKEKSR